MKSLQADGQTDGWLEKLTWAFSSGELKKQLISLRLLSWMHQPKNIPLDELNGLINKDSSAMSKNIHDKQR